MKKHKDEWKDYVDRMCVGSAPRNIVAKLLSDPRWKTDLERKEVFRDLTRSVKEGGYSPRMFDYFKKELETRQTIEYKKKCKAIKIKNPKKEALTDEIPTSLDPTAFSLLKLLPAGVNGD
jgi:hypothetical protein